MSVKGGGGVSRPPVLRMCELRNELEQLRSAAALENSADRGPRSPSPSPACVPQADQQPWRRSPRAPPPKQPCYRVPFKAATPRSSHKKSTPLKMRPRPPTLKRTPNSQTSCYKSLFTPEKNNFKHHPRAGNMSAEKSNKKEVVFTAPHQKVVNFQTGCNEKHSRDLNSLDVMMDKLNLSNNASQISLNQSKILTPQSSHISSNLILKECRENIVTPYKIQNDKKHETPALLSNVSYNKSRTPLFPLKDPMTFGSHYKPGFKPNNRLLSVKEKENSLLQSNIDSKFLETSIENSLVNLQISNHTKTSNKSSDDSCSISTHMPIHGNKPVIQREIKFENSLTDLHTSCHLTLPRKCSDDSSSLSNPTKSCESKHTKQEEIISENISKTENHNIQRCESGKPEMKVLSPDLLLNNIVKPKAIEICQMPHIVSPEIFNKPLNCKKSINNEKLLINSKQNSQFTQNNEVHNNFPDNIHPTLSNDVKNEIDTNSKVKNSVSPLKSDLNLILSEVKTTEDKTIKQFKTMTIRGKNYTILGKLGSGGSSEVLKVMSVEDSSMYAVKCVNLAVQASVAESYINEVKLLKRLQGSEKVITLYDYEFAKQKILHVLLEMGDVDLSSLLKSYRQRGKSLPYPIMIGYWTEMLSAVNYIHSKGVIHSDLKPANFLLVHGRLKLIDFGIASSLNVDATSIMKDATVGTFNYLSPEAIAMNSGGNVTAKISYKSDVWSLGCILYSMIYGRTPFSHISHMYAKLAALSNPNQKIEYPPLDGVPPVLIKALRWCLTFDVKKRPSVQDLIDLPYINCTNARSPSESSQDVPLTIIEKIKSALNDSEWRIIAKILDDARKSS